MKGKNRKARIKFKLPQLGSNGEIISFPAYITDLADQFTSNWNSEQYYGIQDPIGNFVGTSRKIDCSFKIIAASAEESVEYQQKLNKLAQSLYPTYDENTIPKSSPLIGVNFHNIIRDRTAGGFLYGWIDGVSMTPNIGEGGFGFNEFDENDVYFRSWDFSFGLNVIHTERPGFKSDGFTMGDSATFPVDTSGGGDVLRARRVIAELSRNGDEIPSELYADAKLPDPNKAAAARSNVGPNQ